MGLLALYVPNDRRAEEAAGVTVRDFFLFLVHVPSVRFSDHRWTHVLCIDRL